MLKQLTVVLAFLIFICIQADAHGQLAQTESILAQANIQPTKESIRKYLAALQPDSDLIERTNGLLAQLGSDNYSERESALRELLAMPMVPSELLAAARNHPDPEIRFRANKVLPVQPHNRRLVWAILITVREKKLSGLAPDLIDAMRLHFEDEQITRLSRRALPVTILPADQPLIEKLLLDSNAQIRIAAIESLVELRGADAAKELQEKLKDPDDQVQLAAAVGLANTGHRQALSALVRLLSSGDMTVRASSISALREITGKTCGYVPYSSPAQRERSISKWNEWLSDEGNSIKLDRPILNQPRHHFGNTLICQYSTDFVLEVDSEGKELRRLGGYDGPWGARRLHNGNVLVNWYDSSCVVEYDSEGNEVWKYSSPDMSYPWSAEPTDSGNVLIAHGRFVIEVTREGAIAWKESFDAAPSHALRLESGNTLVSVMNGGSGYVVEIEPDGTEIARIDRLNYPYRIQRLDNGNTLVVERGANKIVEYGIDMKTVVWSYDSGLNGPDSAQRLPNGNTLISDALQIIEISPTGDLISHRPFSQGIVWQY